MGTFEFNDPEEPGTIRQKLIFEGGLLIDVMVISGKKGEWNCWLTFASVLQLFIVIPKKYHEVLERAIREKKAGGGK